MRSVAAALAVLEAVSEHQPAGATEVARAADLPKTTAHRMLHALADLGWIRPADDPPGHWVITSKASSIGARLLPGHELRAVALTVMRRLAARTGETIHFSVPDHRYVVLIDKVEGGNPVRTTATIGSRVPTHATSAGHAVLAAMPEDDCRALVFGAPLEALTEDTVTDPVRLMTALETVRAQGYAVSVRSRHVDVAAVGAAILDGDGAPIAALSISMPVQRFPEHLWAEYGELVRQGAGDCSAPRRR
ncbi:IclR family transcriptional regulator [Pseudonocardia nematodicida]|uniref:IclR family transcriptional regulator n=1 Tax=Pseudonocardia nematodicida TaxID=1206997 RepID=A0ABV1KIH8_9PSEU